MRSLFILSTFLFSHSFSPCTPPSNFFDPTGTYILRGDVTRNKVTSHSGEIRVKLIDSDRIAICFYINKGYPGYESGSFIDTIVYENGNARYYPGKDSSCVILFYFHQRKVEIQECYTQPNICCGFAHGVLTSAVFKKSSDARPIIQDLSTHGVAP